MIRRYFYAALSKATDAEAVSICTDVIQMEKCSIPFLCKCTENVHLDITWVDSTDHVRYSLTFSLQFTVQMVQFPSDVLSTQCPEAARHPPLWVPWTLWFHPKVINPLQTFPLLSHGISVCSDRSPYSADSFSNRTLNDMFCLVLERRLFMSFTTRVITRSEPITFAHIACW